MTTFSAHKHSTRGFIFQEAPMAATEVSQHTRSQASEAEECAAESPVDAAEAAGLCYVTDRSPGIQRKRRGKHFSYLSPDGKVIQKPEVLKRIQALKIPPAWKNVWICPQSQGHLQATGRDAKGRKQYRYHDRWREVRDETKYEHLILFGESLPALRRRVEEDLKASGLSYAKVLATITRLLDITFIRVGNEEYAQSNASYGLTTLRNRHVSIKGDEISLRFRGKRGIKHTIDVHDRELARIVKRCRDLPGQ
jgi:DNA topoisomerase I